VTVMACTHAGGTSSDAVSSYRCGTPPADFAVCTSDADCTTVARGCYCGAQPVDGVATKYAAQAQACEQMAAQQCALGCANAPGQTAQDGITTTSGTIAVHCVPQGQVSLCQTYVP